jgi:transcriptional regulator with XRE-family HTH domain
MAALYPNIYKRARKVTLLTQEEAAERLHISPETLKRYEGGRLTPPDETVARMCEVYGARWLALEHAQATDRLGILPELEPKPLPMATISLTNRLRDAADRLAGLLRIAEDGVIDDAERPEFDDIVQDLRETIAAAYQVIYADGAKKERPEAGTSKRSRSQRKTSENHCKAIVPQKKRNVKALREEARA